MPTLKPDMQCRAFAYIRLYECRAITYIFFNAHSFYLIFQCVIDLSTQALTRPCAVLLPTKTPSYRVLTYVFSLAARPPEARKAI